MVKKNTGKRKKEITNMWFRRIQGKGKKRLQICGLEGYREKEKRGYKYVV